MRAAIASSTTVSGSRRPPRDAFTPTRLAYSGGQVGQPWRCSSTAARVAVVELAVQVGRDVPSGAPASERLGEAGLATGVAFGQGVHEHHSTPSQALLRGRQPGGHRRGDLGRGPADDVVEHDGHPVDDRQPGEPVLELVAQLRPLQDDLRGDRIPVVAPVGLDVLDVELVVVDARAVDDPVDEAAPEPGRQGLRLAELIASTPGPDDRLLGAVLRLVRITDQAVGETHEARQLGDEGRRERVAVGARRPGIGLHRHVPGCPALRPVSAAGERC